MTPEIGTRIHGWLVVGPRVGKAILCRCSCGVERMVNSNRIARGATKSCGHDKYRTHSSKYPELWDKGCAADVAIAYSEQAAFLAREKDLFEARVRKAFARDPSVTVPALCVRFGAAETTIRRIVPQAGDDVWITPRETARAWCPPAVFRRALGKRKPVQETVDTERADGKRGAA